MPKTSPIRSSVLVELRLVTDRHRQIDTRVISFPSLFFCRSIGVSIGYVVCGFEKF